MSDNLKDLKNNFEDCDNDSELDSFTMYSDYTDKQVDMGMDETDKESCCKRRTIFSTKRGRKSYTYSSKINYDIFSNGNDDDDDDEEDFTMKNEEDVEGDGDDDNEDNQDNEDATVDGQFYVDSNDTADDCDFDETEETEETEGVQDYTAEEENIHSDDYDNQEQDVEEDEDEEDEEEDSGDRDAEVDDKDNETEETEETEKTETGYNKNIKREIEIIKRKIEIQILKRQLKKKVLDLNMLKKMRNYKYVITTNDKKCFYFNDKTKANEYMNYIANKKMRNIKEKNPYLFLYKTDYGRKINIFSRNPNYVFSYDKLEFSIKCEVIKQYIF